MGRCDAETETLIPTIGAVFDDFHCLHCGEDNSATWWPTCEWCGHVQTRATPPPIAFTAKVFGGDASEDVSPTLRAGQFDGSHANGGVMPAVAYAVALRGRDGGGSVELGDDIAFALRTGGGGGDKPHVLASIDVLPFDTTQITSPTNRSTPVAGDTDHPLQASAHPPAICVTEPVTHSLTSEGFDASEDGTGRGNLIVCHGSQDPVTQENLALPVQRNNGLENVILEPPHMAVRRLVPTECERLQGFPDGYTRIPVRRYTKKQVTKNRPEDYWERDANGDWWLMTADSVRYKQLGNSFPVPVIRWIGERITRNLLQHSLDGTIG